MGSERLVVDLQRRAGVHTYTSRWRANASTTQRMVELHPARAIPATGWDPPGWFGRSGPVVLEIGSGYGAAAIAYAAAHPEHDLITAEVHVPGIARMLADAQPLALTNLWSHEGDALPLLDRIPAHTLHAIHLFFPDPWPKARHAKRRFIQQHTLDHCAQRLALGAQLLIATDHAAYAEHVRAQVHHHNQRQRARTGAPSWTIREGERPHWRPVDGFERKGRRAGRDVVEFSLTLTNWSG